MVALSGREKFRKASDYYGMIILPVLVHKISNWQRKSEGNTSIKKVCASSPKDPESHKCTLIPLLGILPQIKVVLQCPVCLAIQETSIAHYFLLYQNKHTSGNAKIL